MPPDAELLLQLDDVDLDRKLTALRAMATQTSGAYTLLGPELYALQAAQECFVAAARVPAAPRRARQLIDR